MDLLVLISLIYYSEWVPKILHRPQFQLPSLKRMRIIIFRNVLKNYTESNMLKGYAWNHGNVLGFFLVRIVLFLVCIMIYSRMDHL